MMTEELLKKIVSLVTQQAEEIKELKSALADLRGDHIALCRQVVGLDDLTKKE